MRPLRVGGAGDRDGHKHHARAGPLRGCQRLRVPGIARRCLRADPQARLRAAQSDDGRRVGPGRVAGAEE